MNNKVNKKWMWVLILSLIPLVVTALVYRQLPDQVPMHWNLNGEVDRYGSKFEMWYIAAIAPVLAVMFYFLPKIDPRKQNYGKFTKAYAILVVLIILFMSGVQVLIVMETLYPGSVSITKIVLIGVGILLAVIGNYLPKIKNNFFIGIKTPWTLSSPEVWNKTHRIAGLLFVVGGLLVAVLGLLPGNQIKLIVLLAVIIVISVIPAAMSYVWYEQEKRTKLRDDSHE